MENNLEVRVFDVLGQLIENKISVPYESDIQFGGTLARGVYLIEVKQGDKVEVQRIVKGD